MASAIRGRESARGEPGKKARARSSMTRVRMKKSKASSVHPRNPARTALRWLAVSVTARVLTIRAAAYQKTFHVLASRPAAHHEAHHGHKRSFVVFVIVVAFVIGPWAVDSRR